MQDEMSRDATQRMSKCVALLKDHYRKMRTGRANTGLLEGLKVEYYGSEVPITQVASVNVEDSRTLVVSPWDKSAVAAVEKAILKSDLGLTPNTAGQVIRLPLPPMTEERRKELTKVARHEAENARVAVRAVRRDLMNELKEMLKEKEAMDFIHTERAVPLVSKRLIRGVSERIDLDGDVILPLNEEEVERVTQDLIENGAESIAVCLLWCFRNDAHEKRIKELISKLAPKIQVSLSSEISPLIREFERTSTTVLNAYLGPVMVKYINNLKETLNNHGLTRPVQIMKCSGGLTPPQYIEREAMASLNSGPVGGVIASRHLAKTMGYQNVVTTDMGGTSFDVGVIYQGEVEEETTPFVAHGVPLQVPTVKVVTVGAGGGSIAWTDGRRLMVGPQSAGAVPGPACYDHGGTGPTVTDALLVLGLLDPENFFGGRKKLNRSKAESAIVGKIADPLGLTLMEAAAGIYEIVTAKMADLIRKVTVGSGYDPRQFVIFAYGGASPAHCALYAEALGAKEVIVPDTASVFSALGTVFSDIKYTYARSELCPLEPDPSVVNRINHVFEEMEKNALTDMVASGFHKEEIIFTRKIDLRYDGQMNELTIPWEGRRVTPEGVQDIRKVFDLAYEMKFGRGMSRAESPMEIVSLRVEALKPTDKPKVVPEPEGPADPGPARTGTRRIYVKRGEPMSATIYQFNRMVPGNLITGPAIIERRDTTIYIPSGHQAKMDGFRHIKIRTGECNDKA